MISSQTRDYILKLAAWVAAVVVCLPIIASVIAIFWFGDGEGLRILDGMTTPIFGGLATFVSLLLALLGHVLLGVKSTQAAVQAVQAGAVSPEAAQAVVTGKPATAEAASAPVAVASEHNGQSGL